MKRLALFARRPVPGQVKTRLIPALTARLACRLHQAMLADAMALLAAAPADERWLYWANSGLDGAAGARGAVAVGGAEIGAATRDDSGIEVVTVPAGVGERSQAGADLGERLERAFSDLLAGGAHAVVFGSDCPWLGAAHTGEAFDALERADVVIGPASDGGYTLIGLRSPRPELFRGIDWGTPRVLEQTLGRAKEHTLTVERLETLDDLDTSEDLVRAIERLLERRVASEGPAQSMARNLERALEQIGLLPTPTTARSS
jgi:rSAM/selenodomain-associated transferase 1